MERDPYPIGVDENEARTQWHKKYGDHLKNYSSLNFESVNPYKRVDEIATRLKVLPNNLKSNRPHSITIDTGANQYDLYDLVLALIDKIEDKK